MENMRLNSPSISPYCEKLMLQLFIEHRVFKMFREDDYWNDSIRDALGIPVELTKSDKIQILEDLLKNRWVEIQSQQFTSKEWQILEENLQIVQKLLQLSDCETAIFRLSAYTKSNSALDDIFNAIKGNLVKFIPIFKSILGFSEKEIKIAFRKKGKLYKYDLLDSRYSYDCMQDYLSYGDMIDIDDLILFPINKRTLLKYCLKDAPKSTLVQSDFDHLAEMRDQFQRHLENAIKTGKKGTNILIWGKSGTGKTELALYLAQQLKAEGYLLSCEDDDGETIRPNKRLDYCIMAQTLLSQQNSVIIFDEIEDVFCGGLFERSAAQENKAWTNQLLEENTTPIIWLSNSVYSIDEAFLRRFDFVYEMPSMPLAKKEALIMKLSDHKLLPAYATHFAKNENISNGLVSRACAVLKSEGESLSPVTFSEKMQSWFNQTLKAQGYAQLEKLNLYKADYNLNWVNCEEDLQQISEGLIRNKSGRICCYGPAGTGKTAWANWLGVAADMPVLVKRGSDLVDKYVGETEKNIAAAFQQATENQMVLVFDEVDSFLFDRVGATRSWERGMVNEMLTQIERFEGLLVVSTNLMDSLDPAVLRRFDIKLKFDFLTEKQIHNVAKEQAQKLNLTLSEIDLAQLATQQHLTLGDFAAVARRHRFAPFKQSEDWIKALMQECALKRIKKSSIGFI